MVPSNWKKDDVRTEQSKSIARLKPIDFVWAQEIAPNPVKGYSEPGAFALSQTSVSHFCVSLIGSRKLAV